ncbi:hypothetical protein [Phreatobacter stygius]|uniref:Uncharacterized protein n=1 Tax=Phreatobacter stygius TaxID=1940610 RepID=A0A4D7BHA5_9HYPH|nr:hypothetical protein [Phreatobacter stygius]QCI67242.1 hypothetical protein E8M01_25215 [Phreatobacter stygius]
MPTVFDGELFADYHQFYLADAGAVATAEPTPWTDADVGRRLHPEDRLVAISTARNMTVPVRVELHDAAPALDLAEADHLVQGSLLTAGEVVIAGCTDYLPDAARFNAPPGHLRVLAVFSGLGTISEDGLEGDDRYVLHLWPGQAVAVTVHRQWDDPAESLAAGPAA